MGWGRIRRIGSGTSIWRIGWVGRICRMRWGRICRMGWASVGWGRICRMG
jgi:hypothetical protein